MGGKAELYKFQIHMKKEYLIQKGFVEEPHKVLTSVFVLDVGRSRKIKIGSFHTPNEVVFISQTDYNSKKEDLVCVHNFDYDGYLTELKLNIIISLFV